MPLPKEELYTIGDIYSLPEGERAELIDGQIYDMAPPSRHHQEISMELSTAIQSYIRSKKGNCRVYAAPFAVQLDEDSHTYVEPDSRRMDYYTKLFRYRTAGVREYWIVDPSKNQIIVYDFEHGDMEQFTFQDSIKAGIYEDLFIRLENVE